MVIQWLKEKDRLMEKLNKQEVVQVTRKINANNFYNCYIFDFIHV